MVNCNHVGKFPCESFALPFSVMLRDKNYMKAGYSYTWRQLFQDHLRAEKYWRALWIITVVFFRMFLH